VVMMKHHPIREYNMPRFARVFKVRLDAAANPS
jgi:Cu/Ag efflux protein CusF